MKKQICPFSYKKLLETIDYLEQENKFLQMKLETNQEYKNGYIKGFVSGYIKKMEKCELTNKK